MSSGGVVGTYYGGQARRRRNRERLSLQEVAVTEPLDEAMSPVIGFWMIPNGEGGYIKLKINESYQLGKERHPVIVGNQPFPGWALVANKKLLAPYARKVVKLIDATYHELVTEVGSTDWEEYMENVQDNAKTQGWAFFIEHHSVGWLSYGRATPMIGTFGKEYFEKQYQKPVSVKLPGLANAFRVDRNGKGWVKCTEEEFQKLVQASNKKSKKKFYKGFQEMLEDWVSGKFNAKQTDLRRVLELCKPAVTNQAFRLLDETAVAKFIKRWLNAAKAAGVSLPYTLKSYSLELQDAIKNLDKKGSEQQPPRNKPYPPPPTPPQMEGAGSAQLLMESMISEGILHENASFAKLLANTKNHGRYKVGGMVRVDGKWTNDVSIPGRAENARFVIAAPPLTHIERDGSVVYRWKFKSRADRSTTGKIHLSYLRIMPKKKGIMGFLKGLIKGNGPWEGDCECWCNCEDFRYRMHYANWKSGASHKPTGQNGDSTLAAPVKTNPKMIPLLCKHLTLGGMVFLNDPPKKLIKSVEDLQELARQRTDKVGGYEPVDPKESKELEPGQEPDLEAEEDETGLDGANDQLDDVVDPQAPV